MLKLVPETQQDFSTSNPQTSFMDFIYVFIYLYDFWCWDTDEKLRHKFISKTERRARLKFEPLNFQAPPATEITRSSLNSTNKGSSLSSPNSWRKGRPENTQAQDITQNIPNQNKSNAPNSQKQTEVGSDSSKPWWVAKFGFWLFAPRELCNFPDKGPGLRIAASHLWVLLLGAGSKNRWESHFHWCSEAADFY